MVSGPLSFNTTHKDCWRLAHLGIRWWIPVWDLLGESPWGIRGGTPDGYPRVPPGDPQGDPIEDPPGDPPGDPTGDPPRGYPLGIPQGASPFKPWKNLFVRKLTLKPHYFDLPRRPFNFGATIIQNGWQEAESRPFLVREGENNTK